MQTGRRKILIVDDEQAVRDLFVSTLEPAGLYVMALADPNEGIEAAQKVVPDIIYISLLFPESNGLKVGKSLHAIERLKEIPIVVLVSYEGELDPKYTRTIGIVDVLVKPLRPADILTMTTKLLGEDISSGTVEPAGFHEETEDFHAPAEDDRFLYAAGSEEDTTAGSAPPAGSAEEDVFEMTDEVSGGPQLSPDDDFADGKTDDFADLTPEAEERDTEGDATAFEAEKEDSVGYAEEKYAEDKGEGDEDFFEDVPETKRKSSMRYVLFAALVLLVAAAVFAALETGIFTGRRGQDKLSPAVVKESAAKKEKVTEAVKPGKIEGGGKIEDLQAQKQDQGKTKALSASSSPSKRTERPDVQRAVKASPGETKILNEGLKEPKTFNKRQNKTYSVQVGAFGKEGNAVSFARKLKKKGYDAFVGKGSVGRLHRVLIGRFDDYGKALRQSKVLLQKDGIKSVIYRH